MNIEPPLLAGLCGTEHVQSSLAAAWLVSTGCRVKESIQPWSCGSCLQGHHGEPFDGIFFFLFFVTLGFELRNSHLLGRQSYLLSHSVSIKSLLFAT
jgi:hypothetical protein